MGQSRDGIDWKPIEHGVESSVVYRGGVSEVSFEFTKAGDLVAIGRNEDGDSTGFGIQLFYARKDSLSKWIHLKLSMPWRFDSPRFTITSSGEVLLFARYAPHRYDQAPAWLPMLCQKAINLPVCSGLPKEAAVYRLAPWEEWGETGAGAVQLVRMFEGCAGDTGFFSVTRDLSGEDDSWVVANYTATQCHSHAAWIEGQVSQTHIYVYRCRAMKFA